MIAHYHEEWPYQSKDNEPLLRPKPPKTKRKNSKVQPPDVVPISDIQCQTRLGGLLKHYSRKAPLRSTRLNSSSALPETNPEFENASRRETADFIFAQGGRQFCAAIAPIASHGPAEKPETVHLRFRFACNQPEFAPAPRRKKTDFVFAQGGAQRQPNPGGG